MIRHDVARDAERLEPVVAQVPGTTGLAVFLRGGRVVVHADGDTIGRATVEPRILPARSGSSPARRPAWVR